MSPKDIRTMATKAGFYFKEIPEFAPIQYTVPMQYSEQCFQRFAAMILHEVKAEISEMQQDGFYTIGG